MTPPYMLSFAILLFALATRLDGQARDSVLSNRVCNNRLKLLRMPSFAELGDSARIDAMLASVADSHAHATTVEFRYAKDGSLQGIDVQGGRSRSVQEQLSQDLKEILGLKSVALGPFRLELVRLNATQQLRLLAVTATCEPSSHATTYFTTLLDHIRSTLPRPVLHRDVNIVFILEADGTVSDAWFRGQTRFSPDDSLTMRLFRAMRFDPAVVGTTPVASFVLQPFRF